MTAENQILAIWNEHFCHWNVIIQMSFQPLYTGFIDILNAIVKKKSLWICFETEGLSGMGIVLGSVVNNFTFLTKYAQIAQIFS